MSTDSWNHARVREALGPLGQEVDGAVSARPSTERELAQVLEVLRATGSTTANVSIDRARLDRLVVDELSSTAEVGAGVPLVELERRAQTSRLSLGALPPEAWPMSLGELVEHAAFAFRTNSAGGLEPIAVALSGVLADGTVLSNASVRGPGPSLAALLLGAQQRVGVVTSAVVRLLPWAEAERRLCFSFSEHQRALEALRSALAQGVSFARVRVVLRAGRALVECLIRERSTALERAVSLATLSLDREQGRFESQGHVGEATGPSGEATWASITSVLTQGHVIELHRLSLSTVVARGVRPSERADVPGSLLTAFDATSVLRSTE